MSRIPPHRRYTLQPSARQVSSSSRYAGDDPWVNELLNREIDFSKLIRQRPSIEIVNPRINHIAYAPIRREIHHQYRLRPSTQHNSNSLNSNSTSRTWIIDQTNQPNKHLPKHNSHKRSFDEEESLVRYQRRFIPSKRDSSCVHDDDDGENSENKTLWNLYSRKEKRNILIYIIGIMLYKFGLEAFNGSIVSLAANRYDRDAMQSGMSAKTFEKVGLIIGLNQACQCIGSILIAPLIKRWPTRTVLSISIFLFSIFAALLMIIDGATGGKIKPNPFYPMHEHDYSYYGNYPTNLIIPIYCLTGIAYGMVELIRRIIPRDIVGSDEEKLQRMDALVHVFYEVAGVSGAFVTGLALIPKLGNNYSFIITPILFTLSAIVWFFINALGSKTNLSNDEIPGGQVVNEKTNYLKAILKGFVLFGESVYIGGKIIFSNRKYIWLLPCYTLTLYVHRYIENGLAPQIAKRYLNNSEWSQIIVGGSNFGELLGALAVFIFTKKIHSPIVWLRLDCLLLLIAWYIPFYNPSSISIKHAWIIAATFLPFGFGSAGDDVSLNAHIQSVLSKPELKNRDVSSLGAVMAFLYSSYIILYAICNPLLGKYIDSVYNARQTIRPALIFTAGVQISAISFVILLSTFIPRKSWKLNPRLEE
ncbi:unnamed protein product [Adineta ricciae]|uniref:Uncharacterized protein n=2 Tax=Adineta ricciae TaxID=249248 RepID=A0A814VWR9_ADIRI|nr:unnamed protein product [Adineta ricciae]